MLLIFFKVILNIFRMKRKYCIVQNYVTYDISIQLMKRISLFYVTSDGVMLGTYIMIDPMF